MRTIAVLFLVFVALGGATLVAHATTYEVPSPYSTISDAMLLASAGDVILVSYAKADTPSVAYSDAFTVKSGVRVMAASGQTPIIDAGTLRSSAVSFEPGASSSTILQGFTIRGGTDTVVVVRGSGTIRDCTIGDISPSGSPSSGSACIHAEGNGSVRHCTISTTEGVSAGIRAVDNVQVDSCTVETNSQGGPNTGFDLDGTGGYVALTHSTITGPGEGMTGGIATAGHVKVEDCSVLPTGSTSLAGISSNGGNLTLNRCLVSINNYIGVACGAPGDTVNMNYCNIYVDYGTGAIFSGGAVIGDHNVISLEETDCYSYGIYAGAADGSSSLVKGFLVKTAIDDCNGLGVYAAEDSVTVENVTVDGFADGIFCTSDENVARNCIVSNYVDGYFDVTAEYCIADGSGTNAYTNCTTDGTDVTEDPLYCDRTNEEYDLRVDSYGNPENNGSGEIIGAYGVGCMYGTLARTSSFTIDSGTATLRMTGAVTVPQGNTLTLGGHVDVPVSKVSPEAKLTVNGRLEATGASGAYGLMTFRSAETSPAAGDWYGLDVNSGADVHLDGVLIEHAIYGIDAVAPDSLEVVNSTLASNENIALSLSGIGSNSVGFFQHDSVEVPTDGIGVDLYGNMSGLTLDQNKFAGASSSVAGIQSTDPWTSGTPTITANTFSGFTNGSCIDIGAGTFTFTNNVLADSKYGFLVTGGTVAIGTTSSSSDNTITGMTQGIRCDGVGTTTVRNNQITGNSVGVYALNSGLPDLGNSNQDGKNSITATRTTASQPERCRPPRQRELVGKLPFPDVHIGECPDRRMAVQPASRDRGGDYATGGESERGTPLDCPAQSHPGDEYHLL